MKSARSAPKFGGLGRFVIENNQEKAVIRKDTTEKPNRGCLLSGDTKLPKDIYSDFLLAIG